MDTYTTTKGDYQIELAKKNKSGDKRIHDARDKLENKVIRFTDFHQKVVKNVPSNARDFRRYVKMKYYNHPHYQHYAPTLKNFDFYKPEEGKKFYANPDTWMFDIIYFSNYGNKRKAEELENPHKRQTQPDKDIPYKQVAYLIGININTRYAVGRRIEGKKVSDLIPAFQSLLENELEDMKQLIFDGESAISSKPFQEFCINKGINLRTTNSGIHTQTAPIDRLCRTLRDYYTKFYIANLEEGVKDSKINQWEYYNRKEDSKDLDDKLFTEGIYIRNLFNGTYQTHAPPIPIKYYVCYDEDSEEEFNEGDADIFLEKPKKMSSYDVIKEVDELYEVIDYYNKKPHNGLINILKKASKLFRIPLQIKDEDITPENINQMKGLELLIIKYCQFYNNHLVKKSHKFKLGDKVIVYDCFSSNKGSLKRNTQNILLGDWEIVSINNEIYGVYNNETKKLLHVSKYMVSPLGSH